MPFCDQCGKEIRYGTKFCVGCGAGVGGVAPAAPATAVSPARPKRGFNPLFIIGAAVIIVLVCGALFWRHNLGLNTFIYKNRTPDGYAYIPPGEFMMGCSPGDDDCRDNEKPAHRVRITNGFYMKTTEVTQGEYKSVMGNNPSNFTDCGDECPVEQVSWENAKNYCEKTGSRLPSEAEWEYAARAGTTTKYYWCDSMDGDYAWYHGNSDDETHPVGQKKPNAYGLYDMSGNLWEWVNDWYGENYYASAPTANPKGPVTGEYRVLRGGSWYFYDYIVRVSFRSYGSSGGDNDNIGFRCAQD